MKTPSVSLFCCQCAFELTLRARGRPVVVALLRQDPGRTDAAERVLKRGDEVHRELLAVDGERDGANALAGVGHELAVLPSFPEPFKRGVRGRLEDAVDVVEHDDDVHVLQAHRLDLAGVGAGKECADERVAEMLLDGSANGWMNLLGAVVLPRGRSDMTRLRAGAQLLRFLRWVQLSEGPARMAGAGASGAQRARASGAKLAARVRSVRGRRPSAGGGDDERPK